jgi:hypothetical protein
MRQALFVILSSLGFAASAESCPADFEQFVREFAGSVAFQREHSRFPMEYEYVDNTGPEPKQVDVSLPRERAAEFPEYPSPAKQSAVPLQRTIAAPDSETRAVRLEKPDTDYVLMFHFKKTSACWELVRVENWSL